MRLSRVPPHASTYRRGSHHSAPHRLLFRTGSILTCHEPRGAQWCVAAAQQTVAGAGALHHFLLTFVRDRLPTTNWSMVCMIRVAGSLKLHRSATAALGAPHNAIATPTHVTRVSPSHVASPARSDNTVVRNLQPRGTYLASACAAPGRNNRGIVWRIQISQQLRERDDQRQCPASLWPHRVAALN
jgi:hypothetical protein